MRALGCPDKPIANLDGERFSWKLDGTSEILNFFGFYSPGLSQRSVRLLCSVDGTATDLCQDQFRLRSQKIRRGHNCHAVTNRVT